MTESYDPCSGSKRISMSTDETYMGFLAQCIEALAERDDTDYISMFNRLDAADMTTGYIIKFYDNLHTESWDNLITMLHDMLINKERKLCMKF